MKILFINLLGTYLTSIVSPLSSIQNNNSYIIKNDYVNVFISKKDSNITLLKFAVTIKNF